MKLEYGKYYKRRDGEVVGPLVETPAGMWFGTGGSEVYRFFDVGEYDGWAADGFYNLGQTSNRDLVEEVKIMDKESTGSRLLKPDSPYGAPKLTRSEEIAKLQREIKDREGAIEELHATKSTVTYLKTIPEIMAEHPGYWFSSKGALCEVGDSDITPQMFRHFGKPWEDVTIEHGLDWDDFWFCEKEEKPNE